MLCKEKSDACHYWGLRLIELDFLVTVRSWDNNISKRRLTAMAIDGLLKIGNETVIYRSSSYYRYIF